MNSGIINYSIWSFLYDEMPSNVIIKAITVVYTNQGDTNADICTTERA